MRSRVPGQWYDPRVRHACLAVATAVLTCGCNSLLGIEDLQLVDGKTADSSIDSPPAACYGTFVKACFPAAPTAPLMLSGTIDTGTDSRCVVVKQAMGPDVCAIAGTDVTIGATTVTGTRPLMIVATGTLMVTARLDAGSTIGANPNVGPGANSSLCAATVNGNPSTGLAGGGGGAGGSFGSAGGGGGAGNGAGAGGTIAANAAQPSPSVLRGGCAGGKGGDSGQAGVGGAGGAGGGAIDLVAGGTMSISGLVRASGAAGIHGGSPKAGGGAGGSGGMIVLEAPTISVTGALIANGGGGAEGTLITSIGRDGTDDRNWDQAPTGGSGGSSDAGNGGDGAFLTTIAENGTNAGGGGGGGAGAGGGGGGLGVIRTKGTFTGTMISPAQTPL